LEISKWLDMKKDESCNEKERENIIGEREYVLRERSTAEAATGRSESSERKRERENVAGERENAMDVRKRKRECVLRE